MTISGRAAARPFAGRSNSWPRTFLPDGGGVCGFSVRRPDHAEIQALPDLLMCRSVGSVLWRARRWRRGHAQLAEVTARLRELDSTVRWLAMHAEQFLFLVTSGG